MKKFNLAILLLALCSTVAFCQVEDIPDSKDHPLFTRMPNMFIQGYSKNFNEVELSISDNETKKLEGMRTEIQYVYYSESGAPAPSFFQIVKNYENAVKKYGGKKVHYSSNQGVATLSLRSEGKDIWVGFNDGAGAKEGNFVLTVLEMEAMKQEISANAILDELNAKGSVALYINFETGKSEIKSESQKIVDDIAEMLKANPTLKVSIEGHTDNMGKAASNKTLSENRATSVMNALIKGNIDKSRLSAKGWGQEKPIADNTTDEGKAKNRRVEIVKQ